MKINWVGEVLGSSLELEAKNITYAKSLGLPKVSRYARPPLAVIGGGPSVIDFTNELRGWAGDVWVSGSAFQWAKSIGLVYPTFFTIDQSPQLAIDGRGAKRAILATCCHPKTFDSLKDAKVEIFDLCHSGDGQNHWSTTVTAAPRVAPEMGYRDITFYGCDSSFRTTTHAYNTDLVDDVLIVRCNGKDFVTRPSFLMQAEFLAELFKAAPRLFKYRGDGLLAELMITNEYDVTHAANELADRIMKRAA